MSLDPSDHAGRADALHEADALAYFQAVYEGFTRAERGAGGSLARYYSLGDHTICMRFAGPALLLHLGPALAHLEVEPCAAPALTVCLWDSASTAAPMPLLVNSLIQLLRLRWWEQLDGRRGIKEYASARIRTTFHLGPDILSVLDTQENLAVYWIEDAGRVPYYERGYPLQAIFNWWAQSQGRYYVHAGAIGAPMGGVLLAGQGGSGKSTTALACLSSDLSIAADDYTLVTVDPFPIGFSLYNTVKLRTAEDMDRFPQHAANVSNSGRLHDEKPMIFLHDQYPHDVLRRFPIRAILLPRVAGTFDTSLRPVPAAAALRALAPSTILQLPGTGQDSFRAMGRLAGQVPCYRLDLGTDFGQIPHVIARLLGELS